MHRCFSLTCIIVLLFASKIYCQNSISGSIREAKKGLPLPYASIYLKLHPGIGTVSNSEGAFFLTIPNNSIRDSIIVSFIGYAKAVISIEAFQNETNKTIRLTEDQKILKEVTVFAKDTLLQYLKLAYDKINTNYSQKGLLIKGFYRETNLTEPEKKFIYFSESIIEFYKPSYNVSNYGPVKIIEGGKAEVLDRQDYSNIFFYAGLYSPQRFDFVKERIEFINPKDFHKYTYSVVGEVLNEDRKTFIIKFSPKHNARYEGQFFIDAGSHAYVRAEYKLSSEGIQKENFGKISTFKYESRVYEVQYKANNKLWYPHLIIQDGLGVNSKYKNKLRYTTEFVATKIDQVDKNPISDAEAVPYHAFYTSQENKFNDSFWSKPEVVARTKDLEKTVNLIYKSDQTNQDHIKKDSDKTMNTASPKKGEQLSKLAERISTGFSFAVLPLGNDGGTYQLAYSNFFSLTKDVAHKANVYALGLGLKYYATPNFAIVSKFYGNITGDTKLSFWDLGVEGSRRLVGWKRPLYIQLGLGFYSARYEMNMGNTNPSSDFNIGNTTIDSDEINVGVGQKKSGLLGSIELVYKVRSRLALFIGTSTSVYSKGKDRVFIHEISKSPFGRRSADIPLSAAVFSKDAVIQTQSPIELQNFNLMFEFGLRFGLGK